MANFEYRSMVGDTVCDTLDKRVRRVRQKRRSGYVPFSHPTKKRTTGRLKASGWKKPLLLLSKLLSWRKAKKMGLSRK